MYNILNSDSFVEQIYSLHFNGRTVDNNGITIKIKKSRLIKFIKKLWNNNRWT